jgi:hypothetical protein
MPERLRVGCAFVRTPVSRAGRVSSPPQLCASWWYGLSVRFHGSYVQVARVSSHDRYHWLEGFLRGWFRSGAEVRLVPSRRRIRVERRDGRDPAPQHRCRALVGSAAAPAMPPTRRPGLTLQEPVPTMRWQGSIRAIFPEIGDVEEVTLSGSPADGPGSQQYLCTDEITRALPNDRASCTACAPEILVRSARGVLIQRLTGLPRDGATGALRAINCCRRFGRSPPIDRCHCTHRPRKGPRSSY